jgi:predicted enzyme related to lactoylglutathione lyase
MTWTGRFIWRDLMTTDRKAAGAFYSKVLGWKLDDLKMGNFTISLITAGERRIGSLMEEKEIPYSHWVPYVAVDDVDAICKQVREVGGKVCVNATDAPPLGRFALLEDPQGAIFSVIKRPADKMPPLEAAKAVPPPGHFVWDELATTDPEGAARFYQSLLKWNIEKSALGARSYWMVKHPTLDFAGITNKEYEGRSAWLSYIGVQDLEAVTKNATQHGAEIVVPPTDIPNIGRFSIVTDPVGAAIGFYRSAHS